MKKKKRRRRSDGVRNLLTLPGCFLTELIYCLGKQGLIFWCADTKSVKVGILKCKVDTAGARHYSSEVSSNLLQFDQLVIFTCRYVHVAFLNCFIQNLIPCFKSMPNIKKNVYASVAIFSKVNNLKIIADLLSNTNVSTSSSTSCSRPSYGVERS